MYFDVRIIYKDGTCAVFSNVQLCVIGKYIAIMPCNLNKDIIKIPIDKYKYIRAVKVAFKGFK